jgi:hypothetical protein
MFVVWCMWCYPYFSTREGAECELAIFTACIAVFRYMPLGGSPNASTFDTATVASFELCLARCSADTCSHVTYDYDTRACTIYLPQGVMVT